MKNQNAEKLSAIPNFFQYELSIEDFENYGMNANLREVSTNK